MTVFETDRLQLREMTLEDAAFILELVNTPEWYKYIGDRGIRTIDEARDYIQESYLESYLTHGFGAYVMIRKDSGEAVGFCGLYISAQNWSTPISDLPSYRNMEKKDMLMKPQKKCWNTPKTP